MIYGYITWLLINHNNIPGAIKSYKQPYDMNMYIPSGNLVNVYSLLLKPWPSRNS